MGIGPAGNEKLIYFTRIGSFNKTLKLPISVKINLKKPHFTGKISFNKTLKGVNIVKLKIKEAEKKILEVFEIVPFIRNKQIKEEWEHSFILAFQEQGDRTVDLYVTCLERAVPRIVKETIEKLEGAMYNIIMAPFISDASAGICKEAGVGYCDLSGNCWITTTNIIIVKTGNPNKYPAENHAKTIFRPSAKTTSRILRELLKDVSKTWKIKELAEAVGCSIGLVSRVKTYLCEQRWAEMDSAGLHISDAKSLMKEWSRAYSIEETISCYTLDNIPDFEKKCSAIFRKNNMMFCLTGFSGGVRYAPVVRYTKAHIWIMRNDVEEFLAETGCKEVDSGANVVLYIADSDEVFVDCREINQSLVASPVQIYLDCMQLKGRGEEMAEAIYMKEIAK